MRNAPVQSLSDSLNKYFHYLVTAHLAYQATPQSSPVSEEMFNDAIYGSVNDHPRHSYKMQNAIRSVFGAGLAGFRQTGRSIQEHEHDK